jgi:histidine triad (HIT) family protein
VVKAVVDRQPVNRFHVLVMPRDHYRDLSEVPDAVAERVMLTVKRLSSAVRRAAEPDGVTHWSDDDLTGYGLNVVDHFKFHIIPRYKGEAVSIKWNRTPAPERAELAKIADAIRAELG